jgi:hypothetical protein
MVYFKPGYPNLPYRVYDEMDQMVFRQPFPHVRREKHRRFPVYVYESFAHVFEFILFSLLGELFVAF